MHDRQYFERLEVENLQEYASLAKNSRGRIYQEDIDPTRTVFQRDRDRIVHSKSFRRLKHKTQVFITYENDHFRTRLTHTLEVSQIARHLARLLGVNEDLVEAISLAHDLGHTPFGHAGESVLNELLEDKGGFEHNLQSKRIVERLEKRYPGFPGLNLSIELLDGLMKHFSPFDHPEGIDKAFLIYPSLEAQIVNLADQLAYVNHDLDDGLSSGILSEDELIANVELWQKAELANKIKYTNLSKSQRIFLNVRYLINKMIHGAVNSTEENIRNFDIKNFEDLKGCERQLVDYYPSLKANIVQLQKFLSEKFYSNPRIMDMMEKGKKYVYELFQAFKAAPQLLPPNESDRIENGQSKDRVLADYISGMTDNYAIDEHKRILG